MDEDIFSRIIEAVDEKVSDKDIELDKSNFVEISRKESDKRIAFIDGGQAELLKAVNFSLQFIRIGGLVFKENKKIDSIVNEFFVLISAEGEEYKTEIFSLKGDVIEDIRINFFDACIRDGNEKASVSKIGGVMRRFAELELAKKIISKLDKGDAVVLDGSLKCMVKGEEEYIHRLFEKGEEKGVIISSLAKTSKILSEKGGCVASQLNLAKEGEWQYALDDEDGYEVSIVKLNKASNYVFEFNMYKMQKESSEDVLSILISNSNDAVFPGYPYGLILVDKAARVSNEEKDYLLTKFQAKAGAKWQKIRKFLNVLNSHEILDNI